MEYVKKVLMLRRTDQASSSIKPLSVLARIEIDSGVGEFYISAINLPNVNSANYYAIVVDGSNKVFEFDLGARPTSYTKTFYNLPSVSDGVAIGLYLTTEQIPITLAFANEGKGICLAELKKIIADRCLSRLKQSIKTEKSICNESKCECDNEQIELAQESLSRYNDEAVATENYYEIDSEINQKLTSIKEKSSENLLFENEYAYSSNQTAQEEKRIFAYGAQDEKNACECQEDKSLKENDFSIGTYYESVKDELNQIFFSYSREENLEKIFKGSQWAKIYYTKEKFYVVGLIFENKKAKYICYGVPSKYSKKPPKELDGYSSFIPLSVFDMFGDGYFIIFQDAITGRCVHFN